jgi:hypothetical protein
LDWWVILLLVVLSLVGVVILGLLVTILAILRDLLRLSS